MAPVEIRTDKSTTSTIKRLEDLLRNNGDDKDREIQRLNKMV